MYPAAHLTQFVALEQDRQFYGQPFAHVVPCKYDPYLQLVQVVKDKPL